MFIEYIKLCGSFRRLILPCYLFTYSVTQNADAVVTSHNEMPSTIVWSCWQKYLVDCSTKTF